MTGDKQIAIPKISAAIIAIVVTGILTAVTSAALTSNQNLSTSGTIKTAQTVNKGVYNDETCTQTCGSISGSTMPPGNSNSRIVYIKNTGIKSVTLTKATSSWNPANANGPITLSWNRGGTTLALNKSIDAALTLSGIIINKRHNKLQL